ncbi:MAG: VWA domain-containing protein [Gammaproteobacteria bacterium]
MTEFIFLRPMWLITFIPLVLLIWLVWHKQNNQHNWKHVCDPRLLKHLIVGTEVKKRNIVVWLLLFYGAISIFSLSGPAWDKLPQPVFRQQSSLIILFDLSTSMLAEDVKPSRLVRARLKLLDILKARTEGQTALIVYAGDAFVVTPLTDDTDTIAQLVPSLIPAMMPSQGSRIDLAVLKALDLFKYGGITEGDILLLTDEVPEIYAGAVSKALASNNFGLSILSIGSEQGAPINLPRGGFLKDANGSIVIAKTNNKLLSNLANKNKGRFSTLSVDDNDIQRLMTSKIFENSRSDESDSKHDAAVWRERGPWLILLLLPLALLSFRKGVVFILVLMIFPISEPAYALSWDSLWSNSNQRAKKLFDDGKNKESAELFQQPDWQAAVNYKAGNYDKTIELLEGKNDISSIYNKANALAKLKRYEEALKSYDEVLKKNSEHQDALYNKKLVEDQLKKQQDKNKKDKNKGKDKKSDKNKKDEQKKDGQSQDDPDKKQDDTTNKDSDSESKSDEKKDSKKSQPDEKDDNKSEDNENDISESEKQEEQEKEQQQAKLKQQNDVENKEQQQAVEQWLRKIPDDPAGLMRRKFKYQYQQRNNKPTNEGPSW